MSLYWTFHSSNFRVEQGFFSFSLHRQFAIAQAILISFQRITVFLWIVLFHPAKEDELFVFAAAQVTCQKFGFPSFSIKI